MAEIIEKSKIDVEIDEKEQKNVANGEEKEGFKFVKAREIDKQVEEQRKKREFPKKPGNKVQFNVLMDWLKVLTPEMMERLGIYLYREDPFIIRQLSDPKNPKYIDFITRLHDNPLNEQDIIDAHGGGTYSLWINDEDSKLFEARLIIPMGQYPPKLDYREVVWTKKENIGYFRWCQARGIVDETGKLMSPNTNQNSPQVSGMSGEVMLQMFDKMSTMFGKLSTDQQNQLRQKLGSDDTTKGVMDILLEKMKQEDPNKQLGVITSLMTAMKQMIPEQPKTTENPLTSFLPIITMMIEQGNKQTQNMIEIMKMQIANNQGEKQEKTPMSEMVAMFDMFERIKGNPGKKSTAEIIGDKVSEIGVPLIGLIGNIISLKSNPQPQQHNVTVQNPNVQTNNPATNPNVIQIKQGEAEMRNASPQNVSEAAQSIQQYGGLIHKALNDGTPGYVFAESMVSMFGTAIHAKISGYGVDELINEAKKVPEFWAPIADTWGEGHLRKWIKEFIDYEEILAKLEEDEEELQDGKEGA